MTTTRGARPEVAPGSWARSVLPAGVLARRVARPVRPFLAAVVVVLVLLGSNPLLAADEVLTIVAVEVEHLVAAAVALAVLLPRLRTS